MREIKKAKSGENINNINMIEEITVFEIFLTLFVIMIHVVSESITRYTKPGIISAVFYVFSRFLFFVVPAFLFASALKFIMKYKDKNFNYGKFLISRLKKIYLPYLIWVILYYLYFVFRLKYFPFDMKKLPEHILLGNIASHLYFIVTIMQFYILMPLWRKMCEKIPFIISFAVSLASTYFVRIYLKSVFDEFLYFDRIFAYYLIYWVTGCYFGYNYKKYIRILEKYKIAVYSAAFLLSAHVFLQYLNFCGIIYYKRGEWVHIVFCLIFTIAFYLLIRDGFGLFDIFKNIFKSAAGVSFYVYLTHVIVIFETAHWLDNFGVISVTQRFLIRMFFAYLAPFAVAVAYVKIKRKMTVDFFGKP